MTETSSLLKSEPFRFKFFPQLNALSDLSWVSTDTYITKGLAQRHFNSERLGDKLVSVLAAKQVLPVKEILEACEFFERVRKDVRAETVADFCCGHGFLGILFGVFERQVERILLIDTKPPPEFPTADESDFDSGSLDCRQGAIYDWTDRYSHPVSFRQNIYRE